ncbi:hypothetical protein [Gordonia sp. CPCC 205333]|uniref:hypothetical protein n=1 Tax=Gordonia sp. CPCC 205333 TaxID=3140790 RepID=UPI003AF406A0
MSLLDIFIVSAILVVPVLVIGSTIYVLRRRMKSRRFRGFQGVVQGGGYMGAPLEDERSLPHHFGDPRLPPGVEAGDYDK